VKIRLPYLSEERGPDRKWRLYVRRFGKRIQIKIFPIGSPTFLIAYREALEKLSAGQAPKPIPAAMDYPTGSFGWLAGVYFESVEFKRLDRASQNNRKSIIRSCLAEEFTLKSGDKRPIGQCPIEFVTSQVIKKMRDRRAESPGAANNRRKYLSSMFGWAVEDGHAKSNPCRDVRKIKYATDGYHTWTVAECLQYWGRHPKGTKAGLALALLLWLGIRKGDLVTLGRQHVRNGYFRFVPHKTQYMRVEAIEIPVLPPLQEFIHAGPCGDLNFLVTDYGKPYTRNGFGNKFREWCDQANLHHCTAHGLRKAAATLAAEGGATNPQMCAVFGWTSPQQAEVYIRKANRKRLAAKGVEAMIVEWPGASMPNAPRKNEKT
jgi:integrase